MASVPLGDVHHTPTHDMALSQPDGSFSVSPDSFAARQQRQIHYSPDSGTRTAAFGLGIVNPGSPEVRSDHPRGPVQFESQSHVYPDTSYNSTYSKTPHAGESADAFLLPQTPSTARSFTRPFSKGGTPPTYNNMSFMEPNTPRGWKPRRWCTWPWHWRLHESSFMYLFFLFGVGCAVGHHVYYSTLNGQPADNQVQMLRYGTLLAFASKAGLSAAVVAAYRQRVWATVRTRLMSVAALDSLFSATEDFISLWNLEFIKNAKTAVGLAAFVWYVGPKQPAGSECYHRQEGEVS